MNGKRRRRNEMLDCKVFSFSSFNLKKEEKRKVEKTRPARGREKESSYKIIYICAHTKGE
jgi:phage terminase large subunit GpA-like protein